MMDERQLKEVVAQTAEGMATTLNHMAGLIGETGGKISFQVNLHMARVSDAEIELGVASIDISPFTCSSGAHDIDIAPMVGLCILEQAIHDAIVRVYAQQTAPVVD